MGSAPQGGEMAIDAVIFDLDGVLIDSEPTWSEVRREFVLAHGGRWATDADERMMGMATLEWAQYLRDDLVVPLQVAEIANGVVDQMASRYGSHLPLFPGAVDAVRRLARRWPLGLASSSPSRLIAIALEASGLAPSFQAVVSTEEIGAGKPAPDVYLAVAGRLGVAPDHCAAIEDSTNGLRAARAAGMRVIAIPTASYPPDPIDLARADVVVEALDDLTEAVVDPDGGHFDP
jgi:HAD superfamily hydrolase (TIGR01509 family)